MGRLFDHIDLRVRDINDCETFYRTLLPLLGFTLSVEIPGWLQFEATGTGATEFFGVTEDRAHVANRSRVAFWAESKEDVDRLAEKLRPIGAQQIEGPDFESDSYYAVYFDDPSGNALEICHRTRSFNDRNLASPSKPPAQ